MRNIPFRPPEITEAEIAEWVGTQKCVYLSS